MITFTPQLFTDPIWALIKLGGGDSIEIAIRRPTLSDQLSAFESSQSSREYQLRVFITDWRGVNDAKGQPIPYSWESLNLLCAQYPEAFFELLTATSNVRFNDEDHSKNSELPPLVGGTTTTDATISMTESSNSVVTSDESVVSATSSD